MDYKLVVAKQIEKVVGEHLTLEAIYKLIEVPKYSDHGDLAFPAFSLAKTLRKAPQAIAAEIVEAISDEAIEKAVAVGPYANFFLNRASFSDVLLKEVHEKGEHYGDWDYGQGRNVPVDYSSPNIAKPMSMGHLRSTVIGQAIVNLEKKVGYNPIRINHLGDWGTQFGKLIVAYKLWGDEETVKADPVNELVKLYVEFHSKAEEQPELEDEARAVFKKLEDGDAEMIALWEWFKEESIKEFEKVYRLLGVQYDYYLGEAFYNDKMDEHIDYLEKNGISEVDRGATIVRLDEEELPPALIKKSDGATLYLTRDIATAYYRHRTYDFAKSIYVVGQEQSNHFKQLKAVLSKMGNEWSDDMTHVAFGLITINGRKMSTRKGEIVLLENVLAEASKLALEQIEQKNPTLPNKEEVARQVGIGAVIFQDLKNDRLNSISFSLDEVVQFEGETGPYIQYTRARAMSILKKAGKSIDYTKPLAVEDDYAWEVLKQIENYPNVVKYAEEKFEPSVVAKFVISLAQAFNKYYANSRILTEDEGLNARLALVEVTASILKQGLAILGVESPDEM